MALTRYGVGSATGSGANIPDAPVDGVLYGRKDGDWSQAVEPAELAAHLADTTDAHDASAISILDTANDFTATDVEGALAELQADAEAHLADTTDAHAASAITNTPAGGIAATDVQTALNELDTEKAPKASPTFTGTLTADIVSAGATQVTSLTSYTNDAAGWGTAMVKSGPSALSYPRLLLSDERGTDTYFEVNAGNTNQVLEIKDLVSSDTVLSLRGDYTAALQGGTQSAGTGIAFPASQSASADANTLDDYEEGTWTPGIAFGGGTTGLTYTAQAGAYTKIGNRVILTGQLTVNAKGSSTGAITVTGFPFTASSSNARGGCGASYYGGTTLTSGGVTVLLTASTTSAALFQEGTGSTSLMTDTNVSAGFDLYFTMSYHI